MKKHSAKTMQGAPRRWGHAQEDHVTDPYRWTQKPDGFAVCPQCEAVYEAGRWHWRNRPEGTTTLTCQACHRINDNYPAGVVHLAGARLSRLKNQILQLARHQEEIERKEHPLNRIMAVEDAPDGLLVRTTDIHLPRRIGEAVQRAYKGELEMHFDKAAYFVRVSWTSPA